MRKMYRPSNLSSMRSKIVQWTIRVSKIVKVGTAPRLHGDLDPFGRSFTHGKTLSRRLDAGG